MTPDFIPQKLAAAFRRPPRAARNLLTAAAPFAVCAVLLLTALPLLDDYGVHFDQVHQRRLAQATVDYVSQVNDDLLRDDGSGAGTDRYYGVAFFGLLHLVERGLGLADDHSITLSRHFLTHLLFLTAGICCYRLVWQLFGSRWLAILAMLLFLLHPRLYAHSFFNTKDLPFLSMFLIALYLVERAFRRDTWAAFLLAGVAIGLLTNIRVMGLLLFPAVLALRGLDLFSAAGAARRPHILLTGGLFATAAALTLYATWPYLWSNPAANFLTALQAMAAFPYANLQLFQGQFWPPDQLPWYYVPVWAAISTPPAVLLLGIIGAAALIGHGIKLPAVIWNNPRLPFGLLLLACLVLPMAAVALLGSTLYNGWRQLFFIYAPFALLAAYGIHWLTAAYPARPMRAAVYALAALSLALTAIQLVQLHPYGEIYFNFLPDRARPEQLRGQYDLPYSRAPLMAGYRYLLDANPGTTLNLSGPPPETWQLLPPEQRRRITFDPSRDPDYYLIPVHRRYTSTGRERTVFPPPVYREMRYNNTVLTVATPDLSQVDAATAAGYRQLYQAATAGTHLLQGNFDAYRYNDRLVLVKEPCQPGDLASPLRADLYPAAPRQLPTAGRPAAAFIRSGDLLGVKFDGKCLAAAPWPDYPLSRIRIYQLKAGAVAWESDYYTADYAAAFHAQYAAVQSIQPAAQSVYNLYRQDNTLIYLKQPCTAADTQARFFLHILPADPADLPTTRQPAGFDNHDFAFAERGIRLEQKCLAIIPLPDYPITSLRTGQFAPGPGNLWQVELAIRE